jgi:uncharacterized protein YndB with AHSA1/START domain
MPGTTLNSIVLNASAKQIYSAFTDQAALEYWLAPDGMKGKIHNFDLREGGGYEMSLYYPDSETIGKTTANEDRFRSTFTTLQPYRRIVQLIHFQSDDPGFTGEMTMEAQLEDMGNESTKLTITFTNIPAGINPEDNEEGTEQSLQKLALYLAKR